MTLLEVCLALLLTGLLSMGLLLQYQEDPTNVHQALWKVGNDVRFAQHRAMVTGTKHGFRTVSSTQFEIYEGDPSNLILDPSTRQPMRVDLAGEYRDVQFHGSYQIEFDALGRPVTGAGTSVRLVGGAAAKSFSVAPNTGALSF